jgi:hypothetical protein
MAEKRKEKLKAYPKPQKVRELIIALLKRVQA